MGDKVSSSEAARAPPCSTVGDLQTQIRRLTLYDALGFKVFGREPGSMRINGELQDEIHMYLRLAEGYPSWDS